MDSNAAPPASAQPTRQEPPGLAEGREPSGVSRDLFIAVSIVSLFSFAGLVALALLTVVAGLGLYTENARLGGEVKALSSRVEYLGDETTRLWIASDMYTAGVTEDLYTCSVLFCADGVVTIDVGTQGPLDDGYEGEGRFTVGGSKLRASLLEYVQRFKESYEGAKSRTMAAFSALELRITVYGYEAATYKSGVLELAQGD